MNILIRWKKTYIPHTVFENVKTFLEADVLVEEAMTKYGSAIEIFVLDEHHIVASLRTIR